jgi:hypothetical protein
MCSEGHARDVGVQLNGCCWADAGLIMVDSERRLKWRCQLLTASSYLR